MSFVPLTMPAILLLYERSFVFFFDIGFLHQNLTRNVYNEFNHPREVQNELIFFLTNYTKDL